MRQRGIVLQVEPKRLVLLTPTGEFRSIKRPRTEVQVGQELFFEAGARTPVAFKLIAACLVAAVLISGGWFTAVWPAAAAYVSVGTGTDEVELAVNRFGRVVDVRNTAGSTPAAADVKNHTVTDAVQEIMQRSNGSAVVAAVSPAGAKNSGHAEAVQGAVEKAVSSQRGVVVKVPAAVRKAAATMGVPTSQLVIMLQAEKKNSGGAAGVLKGKSAGKPADPKEVISTMGDFKEEIEAPSPEVIERVQTAVEESRHNGKDTAPGQIQENQPKDTTPITPGSDSNSSEAGDSDNVNPGDGGNDSDKGGGKKTSATNDGQGKIPPGQLKGEPEVFQPRTSSTNQGGPRVTHEKSHTAKTSQGNGSSGKDKNGKEH